MVLENLTDLERNALLMALYEAQCGGTVEDNLRGQGRLMAKLGFSLEETAMSLSEDARILRAMGWHGGRAEIEEAAAETGAGGDGILLRITPEYQQGQADMKEALLSYLTCNHKWRGHKNPDTADGPGEWHLLCEECGAEKEEELEGLGLHSKCVTRAESTVVYLADGNKVALRLTNAPNRPYLKVEPQTIVFTPEPIVRSAAGPGPESQADSQKAPIVIFDENEDEPEIYSRSDCMLDTICPRVEECKPMNECRAHTFIGDKFR